MDVTSKGYIAVATGCRQLQTLRMYACAHVDNAVLQACGELLPELRVIDICGAHMATDDGAQVSQHLSIACFPRYFFQKSGQKTSLPITVSVP